MACHLNRYGGHLGRTLQQLHLVKGFQQGFPQGDSPMVLLKKDGVVEGLYGNLLSKVDRTHQAVRNHHRLFKDIVGLSYHCGVDGTLAVLGDGCEG